MALFKYGRFLSNSDDAALEGTFAPGSVASRPGIYRCVNCGDEIAIAGGHSLPPQNHRQHSPERGPIAWQAVVLALQQ